jgi:acyl-CoA synthetase (NDP forming)
LGIVRVNSTEELVLTANAFAKAGQLPGRRLGIVAISGGSCDLAADLAEDAGIMLPIFKEQTKSDLRALLPVLGPANNPLDVTGAAMNNQDLMGKLLGVVTHDPQLDAVLCLMELPADETPQSRFMMNILAGIGQALDRSPIPAFLLQMSSNDVRRAGRNFLESNGIPFLSGGLHILIPAIGKLMDWTEQYRAAQALEHETPAEDVSAIRLETAAVGSWSEYQARAFLEQHGVPVIPAALVTSVDQAAGAAQAMGLPVALKIASPDIVHKSDIGGVKLGLQTEEEVGSAFTQVMSSARAVTPAPRIEGVLVSPMRSSGVELLVGVTHDASWGQVLAVGMGGIWVEVLKDTSLRVLPVTREDVRMMLSELQGAMLLQGARGSKPADMDALVEVIYRVAELAQCLKGDLESLEINPLRVDGSQIEALDAIITWRR